MDSTRERLSKQDHAKNYPSTVAEAEVMLMESAIGSYEITTVADLITPRSRPLPEKFAARIVATIAANPRAFGRLFGHAIAAAAEQGGVRG